LGKTRVDALYLLQDTTFFSSLPNPSYFSDDGQTLIGRWSHSSLFLYIFYIAGLVLIMNMQIKKTLKNVKQRTLYME